MARRRKIISETEVDGILADASEAVEESFVPEIEPQDWPAHTEEFGKKTKAVKDYFSHPKFSKFKKGVN